MLSRIASWLIGWVVLSAGLVGSPAYAQNNNPFFGFEFVLQPLAIKWACGGQKDQDLSQIDTLIVAFPEDAERAELRPMVDTLSEMASGLGSLSQVLGAELSGQQIDRLCAVALPLNIAWVTPKQLVGDDENGVPTEQKKAWAEFWKIIESL